MGGVGRGRRENDNVKLMMLCMDGGGRASVVEHSIFFGSNLTHCRL